MKKFLMSFLMLFLICFLSGAVYATSITDTFDDDYNYWPTWGNGSDDGADVVGGPDITKVAVTYDDTSLILEQIEVWVAPPPDDSSYGGSSLFIGTNTNTTWQYYLDDEDIYSVNNVSLYDHTAGVYGLSTSIVPSFREKHPVSLQGAYVDSLETSNAPLEFYYASGILTYDFTNLDVDDQIILSNDYMIGYTVKCANDVFLTPVSEPATMLLLGTGLIGLGIFGRRKFIKK